MVSFDYRHLLLNNDRISKRIQSLQAYFDQKVWLRKWLLSGCFFSLTITLGVWADHLSQNQAVSNWEKTHLPPKQILQYAFESKGLRTVKSAKDIQKLHRSLPSTLDEDGSIWIDQDLDCVAIYLLMEPETFFLCKRLPKKLLKWQALGRGWKGFESALELLHPRLEKELPIRSDPREIQY